MEANKNLTGNIDKINLVEKLIKDGSISLADGLLLLQVEEKIVYYPMLTQNPFPFYYGTWATPTLYNGPITSFEVTVLSEN